MSANFLRMALPYCLKRLPSGEYLVLNRYYKPVGFNVVSVDLKYEDYPIGCKIKGINKRNVRSLSWNGSENVEEISLYADGCFPTSGDLHMKAYLEKLSRLAKYRVKLNVKLEKDEI